ncbi:MAG: Rpn family recombination-promoting nuclease/putative transposase [Treponema sp.]|jgi:hypothetical protein|nr:Rpn family recombination-promoting nuclease/putative transposase [Treponema sp.]
MTLMLPKVDIAFKLLFGDERSKNILTDFLKAVLPDLAEEEFEELTIVDPHLKREFIDDKLEILDVKARAANWTEGLEEVAVKMKKRRISVDQIVEDTGLSVEDIAKL